MRRHYSTKKTEEPDFHKLSVDELETVFTTSLRYGLDDTKASKIRIKRGDNQITSARRNIIFSIIGYFFRGFCGLLWVVSVMNILNYLVFVVGSSDLGMLLNAISTLSTIFASAFVYGYQDIESLWIIDNFKKKNSTELDTMTHVIRNGEDKYIPVEEVVVGDIVCLYAGLKVPADIRLFEVRDLILDRSTLTGECEEFEGTVDCTDRAYLKSKNIVFKSTRVKNGEGKGVVVLKGDQTAIGKIAQLTSQTADKEIVLDKELNRFVTIIVTLAIIMAVVVLVWMLTFMRISYPAALTYNQSIQNMVAAMVTFIPNALPVTVAVALMVIAKRLLRSQVLVKNLSIVETFSCLNMLAVDKTGTLTSNKMVVVNASAGSELIDLKEMKKKRFVRTLAIQQMIRACGLCTSARIETRLDDSANKKRDWDKDTFNKVVTGDATDISFVNFVNEFDNMDDILPNYTMLAEIPFSSKNQWMAKIFRLNDEDTMFAREPNDGSNSDLILVKGAPDLLLKKAKFIVEKNGMSREITNEDVNKIVDIQNEWCVQGQRVILVCKKMCDYSTLALSYRTTGELESYIGDSDDLCLVGIVGILDPPREGLAGIIAKIRAAGIRVCMITGDHALTATAMAIQTGIFSSAKFHTIETMIASESQRTKDGKIDRKSLLLTGSDLNNFEQEDWQISSQYEEIVFARVTTEQKLIIVKEFQNEEIIIGVVGDGGNDAPAMKSANVSIALGSANDVALEVSQIVLLDDNFGSILSLIKNGRLTFKNIRKVIIYLLPGGCVGEMVPNLLSIFLGFPSSLTNFTQTVISFVTDVVCSISLVMEKEEIDVMLQQPRTDKTHLVDWKFFFQAYAFIGILIALFSNVFFFMYFSMYANLSPGQLMFTFGNQPEAFSNVTSSGAAALSFSEYLYIAQTITYVCIIITQVLGNVMTIKTNKQSFFQQAPWHSKTRNLWVYLASFFCLIVVILVIYIPAIQNQFYTRDIPIFFYILSLAAGMFIFVLDELRKLCVRKEVFYLDRIAW